MNNVLSQLDETETTFNTSIFFNITYSDPYPGKLIRAYIFFLAVDKL